MQWKTIKEFPDYEVSDEGQVYNTKTNRVLKGSGGTGSNPYLRVTLRRDGKQFTKKIHRLVAEAFLPNPENLSCINHKDENKTNNNVSNLEWCSQAYNNTYGTCQIRAARSKWKPVAAYTKDGELVAEYLSIKEAAKATGCSPSNISSVLRGDWLTCAGYIWKYA